MFSRSKLIIIGAAAVLVIIILAVVIFARKKTAPQPVPSGLPASFTASINQQGQSYRADITPAGSTNAATIDQPELAKYLLVAFNGPVDIMWVSCAPGYTLKNPRSTTRNHVVNDPNVGAGVELLSGETNNLTLTCSKP